MFLMGNKALKRLSLSHIGTAVLGALTTIFVWPSISPALEPTPVRFMPLLATSMTVMNEPITYPAGVAKLTNGVVVLGPGSETGWHTHGVPLTGYIFEGELTVDYGARGTRVFRAGESLAEAIGVPHNGRNLGTTPVKLFVVYIGAEGVALSTKSAPPSSSGPQ
jgi:quercetin dioxygenase-like cupin family protein